jgi:hypothetical protein
MLDFFDRRLASKVGLQNESIFPSSRGSGPESRETAIIKKLTNEEIMPQQDPVRREALPLPAGGMCSKSASRPPWA